MPKITTEESKKQRNFISKKWNDVREIYADNPLCPNKQIHQRVKSYRNFQIGFIIALILSPLFIVLIFTGVESTLVWNNGSILQMQGLNKPTEPLFIGFDGSTELYVDSSNCTVAQKTLIFAIIPANEIEIIKSFNDSEFLMLVLSVQSAFSSNFVGGEDLYLKYQRVMEYINSSSLKLVFGGMVGQTSSIFNIQSKGYFIPICNAIFKPSESDNEYELLAVDIGFRFDTESYHLKSGTIEYTTDFFTYNYDKTRDYIDFTSMPNIDDPTPQIPVYINGTIEYNYLTNIFKDPNDALQQ